ncbi:cell division control protein 14 [Mortierella alpina]|nr:cell division control protein 14 [Mortierella alpina]
MSPAVTMSAQDIHKPISSSALSTPLAPSSTPPPLAASDTCVAGKKHTSTPPPPPIPARSSRRPVSAVLTSGRKLLKSTGADQLSTEISEKNLFTTPESTGRDVAEPHGSIMRPSATGETQARGRSDKPRPRRRQRRRRATTTSVEDIDREASNVCEIIEDRLYFMWTSVYPISTRRTTYLTVDKYLCYQPFFADFGPFDIADVFRFCCLMKERLEMLVHDKTPEEAYAHVEFIYPAIEPYRDAGCGPSTFSLTILDCLRGLRKGLDRGLLRLDQFDVKEYEYYENPRNGDFNWITPSFIAFAAPQDTLTYSDLLKRQAEPMERVPEKECVDHSSLVADFILSVSDAHVNAVKESSASSNDDQDNFESKCPESNSNDSEHSRAEKTTPKSTAKRTPSRLSKSFRNILDYFATHNVQSVIRLNDKTYDEAHFRARGIEHHDLQYPDGTCPPWDIVEKFLSLCMDTIDNKRGVIAVHCMAGLGRTGTLIGVYLMRQYGMTARETIAFLRLMRPGSVVGPQQNWLVANEQRIRQTSWESRQEQLHQHQLLQKMNPHLAGSQVSDSPPQTSRTQSPTASIIATPATDYEQVFSRANSEGLESTWFGAKAEVDDGAMEVLDDEEESSQSMSTEETATEDDSSLEASVSTVQDSSMDEDRTSASSEQDARRVHGPMPLCQVFFSGLESLSAAIEQGSCFRVGGDNEKSLQNGVASEHIGSQDYVIPVQPRKAQPPPQHQHPHHRQGRREGSTNTSSPATTSPKLTATLGDNATLDQSPCQVMEVGRPDGALSSKVETRRPMHEPSVSNSKHHPSSPPSLNGTSPADDLSSLGQSDTQQSKHEAGSPWSNPKRPSSRADDHDICR